MNKKAIAWAFIIRLTIAIILIVAAVSFGASLFRKTDAATESFNKLVVKIEEAKKWNKGEFDSIRLDMDEDSAIFGFDKDAFTIERWNEDEKEHELERFESCVDGKSCVCLCRDKKFDECFCEPLENIDFTDYIVESKLVPPEMLMQFGRTIKGGFAFFRISTYKIKGDLGITLGYSPSGPLRQSPSGPRQRQVFIEKGEGDLIGVCLERPCIPEPR